MSAPWPTSIEVKRAERLVTVSFDNGERFDLPAEYLRVESPSAEVKGHGSVAPPPVTGKETVGITDAEPVGNYAVRFLFDDGHDSGLYTFELLHALGREQKQRWAAYLKRVAAQASKS